MNEIIPYNPAGGMQMNYDILMPKEALESFGTGINFGFHGADENIPDVDQDTIYESAFEESVNENKKLYYGLAAASGVLTGTLTGLFPGKIENAAENSKQLAEKALKQAAKNLGQGKNVQSLIETLQPLIPSDINGMKDLASAPGLLGLAVAMAAQVGNQRYLISQNGELIFTPLDAKKTVKSPDIAGSLLFGFIYWFLQLVVREAEDEAGADKHYKDIPAPLMKLAKKLAKLDMFRNLTTDYVSEIIPIATYLASVAQHVSDDDRDWSEHVKKQVFPVALNEALTRGSYLLLHLHREIAEGKIKSLADLRKCDLNKLFPRENRTLLRMLTISSGTFVAVSTSIVAVRSAAQSAGNPAIFLARFAVSVNLVGIGRFIVALRKDKEYIHEDIDELIQAMKRRAEEYDAAAAKIAESFRCLTLDPAKTQILYSLEWQKTQYDIMRTDKDADRVRKQEWLAQWEAMIVQAMNGGSGYLLKDEVRLYQKIDQNVNQWDDRWLHVIAMELALFKPYTPFEKDDKRFKGLKYCGGYGRIEFCSRQSVISRKQYSNIIECKKKYAKELNGTNEKIVIGAVAATVVAVGTGGLALAFAPEIATVLAGSAVAGLSGAALTNASLAFVGGGALAVGGLGMAGGTAIITGGGALLGALLSGASAATIGYLSSKDNLINECSKLLAFSRVVLIDFYHRPDAVRDLRATLNNDIADLEEDIESMAQAEKDSQKAAAIRKSKDNLKYIRKTVAAMDKLLASETAAEPKAPKKPQAPQMDFFAGCDTEEEIQKRYKTLIKMYHPDVCNDDGTMARTLEEQRTEALKRVNKDK